MKIIVKKPNEKAKVISTDITYVGDLKKLPILACWMLLQI